MDQRKASLWSSTTLGHTTRPALRAPSPTTQAVVRPSSRVWAHLRELDDAPPIRRINGCGTILLGWVRDADLAPHFVKVLWLTVFFVPVLPLRGYVVSSS